MMVALLASTAGRRARRETAGLIHDVVAKKAHRKETVGLGSLLGPSMKSRCRRLAVRQLRERAPETFDAAAQDEVLEVGATDL